MTQMAQMTQMTQRQRMLKAKVALALYHEYGQVPNEAEIDRIYRILDEAVLGAAHFVRQQQKRRSGHVELL